jgi:hypothetical protein
MEAGWRVVPQIRSWYQLWDPETNRITGACAIGAACYAAQPNVQATCDSDAFGIFPQLKDLIKVREADGEVFEGHLSRYITMLNDHNPPDGHGPLQKVATKEEIIAAVKALGY